MFRSYSSRTLSLTTVALCIFSCLTGCVYWLSYGAGVGASGHRPGVLLELLQAQQFELATSAVTAASCGPGGDAVAVLEVLLGGSDLDLQRKALQELAGECVIAGWCCWWHLHWTRAPFRPESRPCWVVGGWDCRM
jgi:hypothetical protein